MRRSAYRLPGEAEWEFACRAGTAAKYWIGDKDKDLIRAGWFRENSAGRTHAAAELQANPFGLYDMHGNVWEWVQDGWEANYYSEFTEKPAVNPGGSASAGSSHVLRGGCWFHSASTSRAARRLDYPPATRGLDFGFRVSISIGAIQQLLNQPMATIPQAIEPEAPTAQPAGTVDFALERKVAERLLRLGKGRFVLGNQERQPISQWNLANLPSKPFCILEADLAAAELTDAEIVALKGCQSLRRLDVSDNPALTQVGFDRLGALPTLISVNASHTGVDSSFVNWLATSPDLESIDLSGTKLEAGVMEAFPLLQSLHSLRLPGTIGGDDLKWLGDGVPFLRELDAVVSDPASIASLAGRPHLVKLGIAGAALTPETIQTLQSMPHLESLVIHQPTSESVALLSQLDPKLVSLKLVQSGDASELTSSDLKPLATIKQLAHLSLRGKLPIDRSVLDEIATMKWLRSFTIDEASDDDRQVFRQQRPDMAFTVGDAS